MRFSALLFLICALSACSKSNGELCVDNYMEIYDQGHPKASAKTRKAVKQLVTVECTDPNSK